MATERLSFDILARDLASASFRSLGRTASDAAGNVRGLSDRLTAVGRQTAEARVGLKGDKETEAELDRLDVKLLRLAKRKIDPEVDLAGFLRTRAEITSLEVALDKLNRKRVDVGGPTGIFSKLAFRILGGGSGALPGLGAAAGEGGGVLASAASSLSVLAPAAAAAGAALAILTPAIAGTAVALASLGGFAALAIPEIVKINKAVDLGGKAWKNLSPAEKDVGRGLKDLKGQFKDLQNIIRPYVVKAFAEALKIIKDLMPAIRPLLVAAGKALDAFLTRIDEWIRSPSGQKFITWLKTTGPKDIKTFTNALWGIASAFGSVVDFMYNAGQTAIRHFKQVVRFFTQTVPTGFDLFLNKVELIWLHLEDDALTTVRNIVGAFALIPGPMGAPFRKAKDSINRTLGQIETRIAQSVARIQGDWDKIHGKTVTLDVFGKGRFAAHSRAEVGAGGVVGYAYGTGAAAAGWALVGERGAELVKMRGGETVIPNHRLRGYATGTGIIPTYGPGPARGLGPWGAHNIMAAETQLVNRIGAILGRAWQQVLNRVAASGFIDTGARSGSAAVAQQFAARMLSSFGWGRTQFGPLLALWNRESGWNSYAVNPSSGAYGIPQSLGHGHPYNLGDYKAQVLWGLRYILGRYGSPSSAWLHELSFGWYDRGGLIKPGWTLALNTTGRPEMVVPNRGSSGGSPQIVLQLPPTATAFDRFMTSWLENAVRVKGGGDVQSTWGTSY